MSNGDGQVEQMRVDYARILAAALLAQQSEAVPDADLGTGELFARLRAAKDANIKKASIMFARWTDAMSALNNLRRRLNENLDLTAEQRNKILAPNSESEMRLINDYAMKVQSAADHNELMSHCSNAMAATELLVREHRCNNLRSSRRCVRFLKRYCSLRFIEMCIDRADDILIKAPK